MSKFQFKKKYGQNFLQDESVIDKIVTSINPDKEDLVIEIGPGAGAITKKIKKYQSQVLAFEIDEETKKYLLPLEDEKTEIIFEDFLETDINQLLRKYKFKDLYIIGNLPYYITTPIIERIIDLNVDPKEMTIMVQKEVADRFLSKPRNRTYGYMTVILNYNFEIEKIVEVGKEKFYPIPKVDSTVIKLKRRKKENLDYTKFKALLKDAFQFKRKTISNNLKKYDIAKIEKTLKSMGHTFTSRAEELDLNTFIELEKILYEEK